MRSLTRIALGIVVTAVAAGVPAATAAAAPTPGTTYRFHDHARPGDGWHVELTVSRDPRWLSQVVLHSERCRATVLTSHIKVREGGQVDSAKAFETGDGRQGTWSLRGVFVDPAHFEGDIRVMAGDCDGGRREFVAHARGGGDRHGGGHHADHRHISGTPDGEYPDLSRASAGQLRRVSRLWRQTWEAARTRFTSERVARSMGYRSQRIRSRPPLMFHLRHSGFAEDGRHLDARRVESLVYWRSKAGGPAVLVALMYRLPLQMRPPLGGRLLGWHTHGDGDTKMTHLWLTRDLRSALANCMPVEALERAQPGLHVDRAAASRRHASMPCPTP